MTHSFYSKYTWISLLLAAVLLLSACTAASPAQSVTTPAAATATTSAVADTATPAAADSTTTDTTAPAAETAAAASAVAETVTPATTASSAASDAMSAASHSKDTEPDYTVVFPQDQINTITITLDPTSWATMQADMTELFGEAGQGGFGPGGQQPQGGQPPTGMQRPQGGQPPTGMQPPNGAPDAGGGMMIMGDFMDENPVWVTATITFNGETWENVGLRYKGNSSLQMAWNSGSLKLPFKLNFDYFEDEYPQIKNQRFYGFDTLSFANSLKDGTAMRDALMTDVLADAGLAASETAYYQVTLDYGEGPVALGLYVAVEETDDTVIEGFFGSDDGNIYKPEGEAAGLPAGSVDQITESFEKENNEDEADWSDVEAVYSALHADTRTSDAAAWRAGLEAVFDVDTYLRTMAFNAISANWDIYGHNFYLYHDPATDQLTWIAWDLNETLSTGGSGGAGGRGGQHTTSLDFAEVTDAWPLTRYLLDDPVYYARYVEALRSVRETAFQPDVLAARVQALAELIGPAMAAESDEATFEAAVEQLTTLIRSQSDAVDVFLAAQ